VVFFAPLPLRFVAFCAPLSRGVGVGLRLVSVVTKGPPKKQTNKGQKTNPKKQPTDFPFFFIFFFRCPLRRLWAVCGHATACGHPQLAAVSSFAS
jgi:hypothetical protein